MRLTCINSEWSRIPFCRIGCVLLPSSGFHRSILRCLHDKAGRGRDLQTLAGHLVRGFHELNAQSHHPGALETNAPHSEPRPLQADRYLAAFDMWCHPAVRNPLHPGYTDEMAAFCLAGRGSAHCPAWALLGHLRHPAQVGASCVRLLIRLRSPLCRFSSVKPSRVIFWTRLSCAS